MSSKWADAVLQAVVFDSVSSKSEKDIHAWRTSFVSMMSLLHGVALAELGGLEHCMPIIEGLDKRSLERLNDPEVQDRVFLVFQWVQDTLVQRITRGGLDVPPPISTRIFQELSNGMLGFNNAIKIHDTPFPFPYVQLITLQLVILAVTSGFVINVFVDSPFWASTFAIVAVGGYNAINEVAIELEDPFGDDANDLPMQEYQNDFNCRLMFCGNLNMGKYKTPGMDPVTQELYDIQEENAWDNLEGTATLDDHDDAEERAQDADDDCILLRWIGAREVQDLRLLATAMEKKSEEPEEPEEENTLFVEGCNAYTDSIVSNPVVVVKEIDEKAASLFAEMDQAAAEDEHADQKVCVDDLHTEQEIPESVDQQHESCGTLVVEPVKARKLKQVQRAQGEDPYVTASITPECISGQSGRTLPDEDAGTAPQWERQHKPRMELQCPGLPTDQLELSLAVLNAREPKVDMVMGSTQIGVAEFLDAPNKVIDKVVQLEVDGNPAGQLTLQIEFIPK